MINLRKAVYYEYIDDIVVEIFDKYKWDAPQKKTFDFIQVLQHTWHINRYKDSHFFRDRCNKFEIEMYNLLKFHRNYNHRFVELN